MEVEKKKPETEKRDNEIIYSKSIKAGKRIYYLDVKKSRNQDLYLAITESKKRVSGFEEEAVVTYEKHKIFLYKEDFEKFSEGIKEVIDFINKEQGEAVQRAEYAPNSSDKDVVNFEKEEGINEETETKKSFFDKFKF